VTQNTLRWHGGLVGHGRRAYHHARATTGCLEGLDAIDSVFVDPDVTVNLAAAVVTVERAAVADVLYFPTQLRLIELMSDVIRQLTPLPSAAGATQCQHC